VLHRLAPDRTLLNWSGATPGDFHEGRPKRQLRVRFILRHVQSTSYAEFADDDVQQVLTLLDFLHNPTHRVGGSLEPLALRLIFKKVETSLALLLEADRFGR
jgi:hypothetical protein